MAIYGTLRNIGLNDKEIKVYLALLKNGRTIPSTLSTLTKINRATVYSIAKGLQSKGLIAEDLSGKTLYLVPLSPKSLTTLIDQQRRELNEKELLIEKAVAELSLISASTEYSIPKIRFVQEDALENFLYQSNERWQKSVLAADKTWWAHQDPSFLAEYKEWVTWYWKQPITRKAKLNLISNASPEEIEMNKKFTKDMRDSRFIKDLQFTSSVWVGGDYLIMIVTRQHPHYLVEIHDKTLAHNMREVFKNLWDKA